MAFCQNCGAELPDGAKFCPDCGAPAEEVSRDAQPGDSVKFDRVLAVIDGDKATFGAPVVDGVSVSANVVKNGRGKKIRVYKMKPKKGYRKAQGHRQPYTKVQIEAING